MNHYLITHQSKKQVRLKEKDLLQEETRILWRSIMIRTSTIPQSERIRSFSNLQNQTRPHFERISETEGSMVNMHLHLPLQAQVQQSKTPSKRPRVRLRETSARNRMTLIALDDGQELNTTGSLRLWSSLAKIGNRSNSTCIPGLLRRHDRTHRSSSESSKRAKWHWNTF